ncbi:hypothetical protein SAY86_015886 [Trapa natans]|uniref:Uncharacterized protein n=1 Tax=Trapa natans TaxID=22666 RepID=A0AAN7LCS1_TRANT|nr:hypothetical protein SAY86_015886 [Trapa natans]
MSTTHGIGPLIGNGLLHGSMQLRVGFNNYSIPVISALPEFMTLRLLLAGLYRPQGAAHRSLLPSVPSPSLFYKRRPWFVSRRGGARGPSSGIPAPLTLAKADDAVDSSAPAARQTASSSSPSPSLETGGPELMGQESVPLEGVIQFEKSDASPLLKNGGNLVLQAFDVFFSWA